MSNLLTAPVRVPPQQSPTDMVSKVKSPSDTTLHKPALHRKELGMDDSGWEMVKNFVELETLEDERRKSVTLSRSTAVVPGIREARDRVECTIVEAEKLKTAI